MRLLSFNPYRTLGIPGVTCMKPDQMMRNLSLVAQADVVLFPETWQLNVLCYGLKKRVFPSPASYDIGYDKVEMTRIFQALAPAHVPHTLIVASDDEGEAQVLEDIGLPAVLKEPRSSMGRGVELIETRTALRNWAAQVSVLYAQEYLPSEADLRVVWVGDRVATAYWRRGGNGFHHNIAKGAVADFDDIPPAALQLVERLCHTLSIDHAGFDLIVQDGHCWLLELNVLFGNSGLAQRGIRVEQLILDYLQRSAGGTTGAATVLPSAMSAGQSESQEMQL